MGPNRVDVVVPVTPAMFDSSFGASRQTNNIMNESSVSRTTLVSSEYGQSANRLSLTPVTPSPVNRSSDGSRVHIRLGSSLSMFQVNFYLDMLEYYLFCMARSLPSARLSLDTSSYRLTKGVYDGNSTASWYHTLRPSYAHHEALMKSIAFNLSVCESFLSYMLPTITALEKGGPTSIWTDSRIDKVLTDERKLNACVFTWTIFTEFYSWPLDDKVITDDISILLFRRIQILPYLLKQILDFKAS